MAKLQFLSLSSAFLNLSAEMKPTLQEREVLLHGSGVGDRIGPVVLREKLRPEVIVGIIHALLLDLLVLAVAGPA